MATHSSIFDWRIPWTEEPGRLQYMGSQKVGDDLETKSPPPHVNPPLRFLYTGLNHITSTGHAKVEILRKLQGTVA